MRLSEFQADRCHPERFWRLEFEWRLQGAGTFQKSDGLRERERMNLFQNLNPATITALAAIFGSLTGALASSVSAWITQRHQDRRDLVAKRIFHREQLYSDFISETARALADAMQHNFQDPNKLVPTYAVLSRIRVSSPDYVLASAERVVEHIIAMYSEPNLTPEEIHSRAAKRDDPLRDFATICRYELESLWKGL
jgi:cell division septum initiation protein DivIVA